MPDFIIRPIRKEDAESLNEMRRMPEVFYNTLAVPSGRIQETERFIAGLGPDSHQFAAVVPEESGREKVIGTVGLNVISSPRMRHSATLNIMVHRDYQNQGVGAALMKTALDLADNWLMLVRVELGVYADNERAIHLYKKMGFEVEGTKRKSVIRDGTYVDELVMGRIRNVQAG
ncbi:GNAT family N-acetyltransferase [Caproiciproducens sp. NJN-50]|uniref:GNAT family N-acetyltransferase n=1 Tax=Acutalibacteraceae TaxID=3082771 RepID=UPI000FFE238F|nr:MULTISPECIES: GNAT family N-acetyltransferase [Acutalibacteraceae]QAT48809.1 GNAT family N-acetyltransferase [Caproiciproducens sp. NJN-50]